MEIWVCSMTDTDFGGTMVLGAFSDFLKAEEQARIWVDNRTNFNTKVIDREVDRTTGKETIYYGAKISKAYDHYTAHIERFFLDRLGV